MLTITDDSMKRDKKSLTSSRMTRKYLRKNSCLIYPTTNIRQLHLCLRYTQHRPGKPEEILRLCTQFLKVLWMIMVPDINPHRARKLTEVAMQT